MVKRVEKKQRGKRTKSAKKNIVIGLEGKNVTEKQYLNHFNSISKNYHIIFSKGNSSDPIGIVEDTIKSLINISLDFKYGDRVFCLIDTDYGSSREKVLESAIALAQKNKIDVLLTNPTFEIWFLLHFKYSSKQYSNNGDVIIELRKYIPDYEKNYDIFSKLSSSTNKAVENSIKLEDYHNRNASMKIMERCPSSKVYELVEILLNDE